MSWFKGAETIETTKPMFPLHINDGDQRVFTLNLDGTYEGSAAEFREALGHMSKQHDARLAVVLWLVLRSVEAEGGDGLDEARAAGRAAYDESMRRAAEGAGT